MKKQTTELAKLKAENLPETVKTGQGQNNS